MAQADALRLLLSGGVIALILAAPRAPARARRCVPRPRALGRSLTWDQGTEMARHAELQIEHDQPVYFCDPQCPWQRGTNENDRRPAAAVLPEGVPTSACHGPGELEAVALALNGRPCKTLGWRTPAEALDELLTTAHDAHVATTG